mmetsp:Transcript_41720/g.37134  ORF Transcript_41720/g.37134 Transcript_41720/m.37134 type:complete len:111 (-) Transcript_41720:430-762(-)
MIFGKNVPALTQGSKIGRKLYNDMFINVLKAPITTFFDRVPTGKILDRFINNLSYMSAGMLHFFSWILHSLFDYITNFGILTVYCSPWLIPIQFIGFYAIYKKRIKIRKV